MVSAEHAEAFRTMAAAVIEAGQQWARIAADVTAALGACTEPAEPVPAPRSTKVATIAKHVKVTKDNLVDRRPTVDVVADSASLTRAERKILAALAQHGTRTTTQVALLTGYSHKSGGYRNALSSLRTKGFITGRGDVTATAAGLDALGPYDPLPAGADLREWWKTTHLGKAERSILDVLANEWPQPVAMDVIADRTGYSASSGGFRNALSRLRSLELAAGRGELVLSESLV